MSKQDNYSEEELIHIACTNSYRVIILQEDWQDIIMEEENFFVHNPAKRVVDLQIVDTLLFYFNELEDFEKCIRIRNFLQEKMN